LYAQGVAIRLRRKNDVKRIGFDCEQIGVECNVMRRAQGQPIAPIIASFFRFSTQMSSVEEKRMADRADRALSPISFKHLKAKSLLASSNADKSAFLVLCAEK
jgi:hypothetical protein